MATIPTSQKLYPVGTQNEEFGKVRYIGLELETTRNINALPKIDDVEWSLDHWTGFPSREREEFAKIIDESGKMIAMIGSDGGDVEIATQPLSERTLLGNCDFNRMLRAYNMYCIPDQQSGTHIHISKLEDDKRNLWRNLYWFSVVYDKQLYAIFRRRSTWALSPKKALQNMGKTKISINEVADLRYPGFGNKGTLIIRRENTYECRGGSASTNANEIKAWALMFKNIVDFCNQTTIVGHRFEEVLPDGNYGDMLRDRLTGEQARQICPIDLYL